MNPFKTRRILIVDDDEGTRYSLAWSLKEAGFEVIEAATGVEALKRVLELPDLMILDVQLPDMNGFEVCRRVRALGSESSIPILHVSACYTTPEQKGLGLDLGADGYLIHPIEAPELIGTVNALLRARDKEKEARRAVKDWQMTFDAISDGVCLVDTQGLILQANKAMLRLLHRNADVIGKPFLSEIERCLSREKVDDEFFTRSRDPSRPKSLLRGYERTYAVSWQEAQRHAADEGSRVYCFADVTERIAAEKELKKAKEVAEAANRAKSAFLANMSHEIRTPLGAVLGFSELLKEPGLQHEEKLEYIETISRNGRELGLLIDDILDLSKVEAGHIQVEHLHLSLSHLLADVLSSFSTKARDKRVELSIDYSGHVPDTIVSDPTRLRQILFNIVGNAVKFTNSGFVKVAVETLRDRRTMLSFRVTDSGRGIGEEDIPKLFQPFSQADATTTRQFGGTGLGLVLSRKLAQTLGGDVVLEKSRLGEGSTFVITIETHPLSDSPPVQKPEILADRSKENIRKELRAPLSGLHILIADDALDNQVLIKQILSRQGATVEVANNGLEAVEKAARDECDLILMDIQMPVLDGYHAARTLRSKGFKKPIIALTAHAMQGEKEKCLLAGCDDHLAKPINQQLLICVVSQYARTASTSPRPFYF